MGTGSGVDFVGRDVLGGKRGAGLETYGWGDPTQASK